MPIDFIKIKSRVFQIRDFLLDIIFPIECQNCGQEGVWLCDRCFRLIEFKPTQHCLTCKKPSLTGEFCSSCRPLFYLDGVIIAADYQNKTISGLIKNLKYNFAAGIAEPLGNFLALFLNNINNQNKLHLFSGDSKKNAINFGNIQDFLLIPVPLHKRRLKWRGFNQVEKIAEVVSKRFNLPIYQDLICIKNKKPQAKLNAAERRENIKGCFAWTGENLYGAKILLLDDVVTTGATMNECAKILKQAGAGQVWGLAIANG